VYVPERVVPEQLRVWLEQLEPQGTLEASHAVVLAPLLILPPHGKQQLDVQLWLAKLPESEPSVQRRDWLEHAVPQAGAALA